MMKRIIVAKWTKQAKRRRKGVYQSRDFMGRRVVKMYDGTTQRTQDANIGLTLRTQREIRETLRQRNSK